MTGSAIAIPLMAAGAASAADGNTWDKVAKCESGGAWSSNAGNGYYGGLQMTQDDWEKYGGLDYALSADQASRSQQIAVAEKVLADKGPGAWPTCGLLSGLGEKSEAAKVDTGVGDTGSANSSGKSLTDDLGLSNSSQTPADSSGSSDTDPGSADSSDYPSESPTTSSPSPSSPAKKGKPGKSDTSHDVAASGSQSPDTSPPAAPELGDTDKSWQVGGSSALVDTGALGGGRHRGGSAVENLVDNHTAASAGRHAARAGDSYTVRAGDSLESIADSLGVPGGWDALYAANKGAIGSDPNHVSAGQTLNVPTETPQK